MSENIRQQMKEEAFQQKFNQVKPKPPLLKNIIWAFVVGVLFAP